MKEKLIQSFDEFISEAHIVFKRKYTDAYPEKKVGLAGPIREKILSFLHEKGTVNKTEMMEFISGLNEETGGNTSRKWLNKNSHLIVVTEKDGMKYYALSKTGQKIHSKIVTGANA